MKFVCERGLAFRGTDETVGSPNNGNYLGLLEPLATVDPFLCQHIQLHANRGKGHTSYLSKTICEEIVKIMGKAAKDTIVRELKEAKYFSISLFTRFNAGHCSHGPALFHSEVCQANRARGKVSSISANGGPYC